MNDSSIGQGQCSQLRPGQATSPDAFPESTARPDDTPWPSEAYGWYVVFILCICGMVAFVDRQIINLLVEDIKRDLQLSDTQISLLQGLAFGLFYAVMAVPLGRLADTGRRNRVIAVGIVVWSIAAAACGLARSFWQLFFARMFVGVGEATLTPAGFSMLADLFRPQRLALPLSVYTGSSFVGSGVALLVGGFVIAQLAELDVVALPLLGELAPWEAAFVLGALPGFVVAVLFFLTVREPRRRASVAATSASVDPDRPSLREVAAFCGRHFRVFAAVFGGISVLAAAQFSLGAWVPAFMIRNYGWAPSEIGYAQGVIFLTAGTAGVVFGGWLADRFQDSGKRDGHLRVALISALATIPFTVAFPLAGSAWGSIGLLVPAMFFGTMAFGAGPALIPVIAPPRMRGLLIALYLLVANIFGQAGGPYLVALFTDRVFGSPELVRYSLAVVPALLLLLGAALVTSGFGGLRAMRS
jgi:MFS family permease